MRTKSAAPKNVDEYIAGFPQDVQERLQEVRATIRAAAPEAEEKISYQIPAFTLSGKYLIYFAGFKKHIGMYPAPAGNAEFRKEISAYKSGKATVKFPLDRPVPLDLVRTIVKLRAKENLSTAPRR
jgi:uncharacterized protein YdhG (YjbR/CyaY superfamily)